MGRTRRINTFDTVIFFIIYFAIACMLVGFHKGYTAVAAYILMIDLLYRRDYDAQKYKNVYHKRFHKCRKISFLLYDFTYISIVTADYYYVARLHR